MPNPISIGLAVLGVACLLFGVYFLSIGSAFGWTMVAVALFVFGAASGAAIALRMAGLLAALGALVLVLAYLGVLPA